MNDLPLRNLRVLVSGAGIAGPAVAYWLSRFGATTTIVEIARTLRTSGFGVDFRGPTHMGVLTKMGVLDQLRDIQTHAGAMRFVDERSDPIFELPAEFAGGEIEVRRCDLSQVLYEHSRERTEYLFGDSVTSLTETPDGVQVTFAHAEARTVDLVIGADGLHSTVRRLVWGPESQYVRELGHYVAHCTVPNDLGASMTPEYYNVPGKMAGLGADQRAPEQAGAFFVFASPRLDYDWHDMDQQKKLLADAYEGLGWHVPRLLDGLREAPELYFDAISRVAVPHWSSGRCALLGDAGFGVTLGGMGVGTSIVGAYVLAGELAGAGGDHRAAFPAYEQRLRRYTGRWQRGANPGEFLAPSTATRLRLRNGTFRSKLVRKLLISSSTAMATGLDLPEYAR